MLLLRGRREDNNVVITVRVDVYEDDFILPAVCTVLPIFGGTGEKGVRNYFEKHSEPLGLILRGRWRQGVEGTR